MSWILTDSSRGLAQKIREKFAKYLRNICEIFAKNLRKICKKFVKNLQKICEKSKFAQNSRIFHEFLANFAWILIFRKFFANFLQIFHEFFTNFSQIFREYFANISRNFREFFVPDHVKSPLDTYLDLKFESSTKVKDRPTKLCHADIYYGFPIFQLGTLFWSSIKNSFKRRRV